MADSFYCKAQEADPVGGHCATQCPDCAHGPRAHLVAAIERLRGQFGVALGLLRECVGPLEVSAAVIESEDGGEAIETLLAQLHKFIADASGVPASVPVNRPATMEEAQHAAQIGACLPNGVLFDAFGRERRRYVRVTLDGSHLILHPRELDAFKANEEEPERFTYTDVYLSPEEADALPEFDGF